MASNNLEYLGSVISADDDIELDVTDILTSVSPPLWFCRKQESIPTPLSSQDCSTLKFSTVPNNTAQNTGGTMQSYRKMVCALRDIARNWWRCRVGVVQELFSAEGFKASINSINKHLLWRNSRFPLR